MRSYKTTGIVIKRTNLGEADRILTLYTRERGRVSVIAKGVRRTKSKMSGHVELFYESEFNLHVGKNLDVVTSVELKNNFLNIVKTKESIYAAYYISELLYSLVADGEASEGIYNLLKSVFESLDGVNFEKVITFFEILLFRELGHHPEVKNCVNCRGKLDAFGTYFDYLEGGIICKDCFKGTNVDMRLEPDVIKMLRVLTYRDFKFASRIKLDKKILNGLIGCANMMRREILGKELKTEKFFR